MALDPEEFVTLTDHGSMKLRAAVSRAMTLLPKERKRTTIVREGEPAILNFEQIKNLAAQWDERLVPIISFAVWAQSGRARAEAVVGSSPRSQDRWSMLAGSAEPITPRALDRWKRDRFSEPSR
jgi:hypothetical protein